MNLLLDTHALLWWLADDRELSREASSAISDARNEVFVSAATAWEIAIKRAMGKLAAPANLLAAIAAGGFQELPITLAHALAAGELPPHHADPFDRMLVAQAKLEGLTLVTRDQRLAAYQIPIVNA